MIASSGGLHRVNADGRNPGRRQRKRKVMLAPDLEQAYAAPSNEVEQAFIAFWRDLLGIEHLGVHDDFFELGGHSLLATQFTTRVRESYKVELSLRRFYETPTVAALAQYVTANLPEPPKDDQISRLMEQIGQMSDEDKRRILEQGHDPRGSD